MSKQVYVLNKMYEHPGGRIHPGVSYTADKWLKIFPNLTYEDLNIKDDWFSPKKEEKPKEWEVISRRNGVGWIHQENMCQGDCEHEIFSVRRLLDNTVFTIGDKLIEYNEEILTIEGFELRYNGVQMWIVTNKKENHGTCISIAEKLPPQPPVDTDTPFQWTDELVLDILNALRISTQIITKFYWKKESIEAFKQSKSTPKEEKLYTKDELLKAQSDAFYAAQEMDFTSTHAVKRYLTFTEYIHSKNK